MELQQIQYENDSPWTRNRFGLNLPRFFVHRIVDEKATQIQINLFFAKVESFLYFLCSSLKIIIQFKSATENYVVNELS